MACQIAAVDALARLYDRTVVARECDAEPAFDATVRRSGVRVCAPVCHDHNEQLMGEPAWLRSIKLRSRVAT